MMISRHRVLPSHVRRASLALAAVLATAAPAAADEPPQPTESPRSHPPSPAQAQAQFRFDPGLRVELVASEPLIASPVKIAFDEEGRLWVVEMLDYPNGPPQGGPPEGRIKVLEDRDDDGRYETGTVFAEHLLFANGVLPWRGGAIVTAAPEIAFLQDTDGDGRADRKEVLYEGFAAENPQLRVSHPTLGFDGWVYVANGLRGGKVRRAGRADAPVFDVSGMDFRFDLVHDRGEAISGMGQYGLTFDAWGRRFVCDNRHHLRHVVLPNRYIKRNPMLAVPEVVEDVSELELGPGGSGGKVYPLSRNWTTSSLHAGRFTAACGVFVYDGDLLPENYRGAAFTCDPTGNLVHEEILQPLGATFRSRPARAGKEFLASPDPWFRPVSLAVGPDGALYVVDMNRAVIEHPEYMPPELKERPDLALGKETGRIWRIVPDGTRDSRPPRPHLGRATTQELVALLGLSNGWWRMTAQRLLLERQDPAAVAPLQEMIRTSERPLARLYAAWLLDGRGALDDALLLRLLRDDHPRVREHAVLLAEQRLAASEPIRDLVLKLAVDPDARLRYQVALSLGEWDDDRVLEPLARIALAGAADRWTRLAVASSVPKRAGALVRTLLRPGSGLMDRDEADRLALLRELAALVGSRRDPAEVVAVLEALGSLAPPAAPRWSMAGLNGLAEGMGRRGTQLGPFLKTLPGAGDLSPTIDGLLTKAAGLAADPHHDAAERLDAILLLAHAPWETAEPVLNRLLREEPAQEIRLAAVRALSAQPRTEVAGLLLEGWRSYTPAIRREVADAMLRQSVRIGSLLDALESRQVLPGDLDAAHVRQLVNSGLPALRDRARTLLQESLPRERLQVLERYQEALHLSGDARHGREVFAKNCATCHRVADAGVDVGPDIADTRTKTRDALLGDILLPNRAIDGNSVAYAVALKDGTVLQGVIAAETATSLTLRRAEGKTDVLLRADIEEIRSTGLSLMPEGLEQGITVAEMADLLAFLKNWRYLGGDVPAGISDTGRATGP